MMWVQIIFHSFMPSQQVQGFSLIFLLSLMMRFCLYYLKIVYE